VEWRLVGESEVLGKNLPQRHFVHNKIPHDQTRARTLDRRGGKPATNRLSYGAAWFENFLATGSVLKQSGWARRSVSEEKVEEIRAGFQRSLRKSIRQVSRQFYVPPTCGLMNGRIFSPFFSFLKLRYLAAYICHPAYAGLDAADQFGGHHVHRTSLRSISSSGVAWRTVSSWLQWMTSQIYEPASMKRLLLYQWTRGKKLNAEWILFVLPVVHM
jgi:hypothetical protein